MIGSGEYIGRDAAIEAMYKDAEANPNHTFWTSQFEALMDIPAADVRPVRRGKWENNHCSACGMMPMGEEIWECCDFAPPKFEWFMNFCPNCGADMREES